MYVGAYFLKVRVDEGACFRRARWSPIGHLDPAFALDSPKAGEVVAVPAGGEFIAGYSALRVGCAHKKYLATWGDFVDDGDVVGAVAEPKNQVTGCGVALWDALDLIPLGV